MTLKIPRIIGHRGAAAYAPENTLVGFHTAADMGVTWVEFDVKLTKDQVPILFHDEKLDRTTGIEGNVRDLTYAEISELDAGSWFGDSFIGIKIPTLEEALDVMLEYDLGFNLEIKPCPGREKETAEAALDVLTQIWDEEERDRVIISSFQAVSLETAFDIAQDWHRGYLLGSNHEEWPENWRDMIDYLKPSTIHFDGRTISEHQVAQLGRFKKPLLAYTINDPDLAAQLEDWGVNGFFTDAPDIF